MPPTTTAMSTDTQTDDLILYEKQNQTEPMDMDDHSVQTDLTNIEFVSTAVQYQQQQMSDTHDICRDLTVCACVEQLVKTRQFLVDTTNKFQTPTVDRSIKVSKQRMTIFEQTSPTNLVLAKSSLKAEQQLIFENFLSQFNIRYSSIIDETTTHLITDSLDESCPLVCPLTLKVIQATARHLPIVSIQWLSTSIDHQIIIPSDTYEIFLGDPTYGYHGGFLRSRIPRLNPLFNGIQFRLECPEQNGYPAILADNRAIRELIYLCGGIINDDNNNEQTTIIVLCHQIKKKKNEKNIAYVKPEWLLASIAHYNLQPFRQFAVTQ